MGTQPRREFSRYKGQMLGSLRARSLRPSGCLIDTRFSNVPKEFLGLVFPNSMSSTSLALTGREALRIVSLKVLPLPSGARYLQRLVCSV